MINEIICIGTSFTEGGGLNPKRPYGDIDPAVIWYKENKEIEIESITQFSWPSQLQTISNIKTRNLGKCGSSIEYLIRNVEEIIEKEDVSDKLFILEYSSWGRSEIWLTKYNQWVIANWGPRDGIDPKKEGYSTMLTTDYNFGEQISSEDTIPYQNYLDNCFNEHEYLLQRDRNFLNLLYKLKSKNIKYQTIILETPYWNTLQFDDTFDYKFISERDLWGHLAEIKLTITHSTNEEIVDGHPSIEGHEYIANLIYTKLKERGDL